MSISSIEGEKANQLFIELDLDKATFGKHFKLIEHESFMQGGEYIGLLSGETTIPSVRVIDGSFIESIRTGIAHFEQYLRAEFGPKISFNFLVYERTSLLNQLKIKHDPDQGPMIELWCVRDQPLQKRIKFTCKTLYTICLKKNSPERLEREAFLEYLKIWTYFGLNKLDLTRT